ncbi:high choriolytic enzyme 1-like [Anableps anableps]
MIPSTSLLLLLLLGLSQALPLEEGGDHEEEKEEGAHNVDITTKILTANDGSDEMVLEGDIVAPTDRNARKCWYKSCLWTKASNGYVVVPYVIGREFSSYERQTIETGMRAFSSSTCVRFQQRTNERDFISVVSKQGCWSELGKTGGMQELSLNKQGCIYSEIAMHELNHALGFQHEQTRSDRNSYIRINWANIIPNSANNFNKHDTNNLNTPYDYSSIMHYGRDAFAVAYGRETITLIPNPNVQIGQRHGLSCWDITRVNLLYNC